jgi:uncharacterized membrane protein YbhN (UPF0104 family)
MALSENARDFWVAAAAAAPVIALAGIVSIPDAFVAGNKLKRTNVTERRAVTSGRQLVGPPNGWVIVYSISNLVAQSFVLIVALLALLDDGMPIPGISVVVIEGVGLLLLLLAALLAGQVGAARQWLEEKQTEAAAKQLAKDIATEMKKKEPWKTGGA